MVESCEMPRYRCLVNMSHFSGKRKLLKPNSCISSLYSKNLYSNFAVVHHLPKNDYSQNVSPLAQTEAELSEHCSALLKIMIDITLSIAQRCSALLSIAQHCLAFSGSVGMNSMFSLVFLVTFYKS